MRDLLSEAPTRPPGYLLALIEWLPPEGAYSACVQDAAPVPEGGKEPKGPHRFYGRGLTWHILADVWDLLAAVNAGKKKPPTYPRPSAKKQKGVSLFDMRPRK